MVFSSDVSWLQEEAVKEADEAAEEYVEADEDEEEEEEEEIEYVNEDELNLDEVTFHRKYNLEILITSVDLARGQEQPP